MSKVPLYGGAEEMVGRLAGSQKDQHVHAIQDAYASAGVPRP
jgi:hypothetical protein